MVLKAGCIKKSTILCCSVNVAQSIEKDLLAAIDGSCDRKLCSQFQLYLYAGILSVFDRCDRLAIYTKCVQSFSG